MKAISCLSCDTSCLSCDISCSTITSLSEFLISCCRIAPSRTQRIYPHVVRRLRFAKSIRKSECCLDSVFAISLSYLPNSCDRSVAVLTASINAERNPLLSNLATPAIVVPPGLVTKSFNSPGCICVSLSKVAVPNTV